MKENSIEKLSSHRNWKVKKTKCIKFDIVQTFLQGRKSVTSVCKNCWIMNAGKEIFWEYNIPL